MAKNGYISKVVATVAAGVILLIVAILLRWGPAIQDNTHAAEINTIEIKQVDKKVDRLIMKQEQFMDKTTATVSEIEKHTAAMKATVKAHHP